jgi:hypothetical protein
MNSPHKSSLVKRNTLLWLAAMALPAFFSLALAGTRFPWQVIVPLLLVGPMLASNKMLCDALGKAGD